MIGSIVEERYLVEEELGNGAMGRVFAARHIRVGRRVAIKVMHDELAQNAAIVERFAREAMVAARLRHPNLVSVLDVGQTPDHRPLLVLELAPGVPMTHLTCDALPGPRVVNLVRQLLKGLAHAHAAGLIHRDLKPDNILVETTRDGVEIPRIVDFGIAVTADRDDSIAGRRLTDANMVIGTPFYMSPEQARAKDLDQRTDLFSLGVIMYELLAGMPPFPGSSIDVALANASKDPPSIADRAGLLVDPLLESFTRKLMARKLEDRFQSAREALEVLALIDLDRIAAARVLGGAPLVDIPSPVFANGSGANAMPQPSAEEVEAVASVTTVLLPKRESQREAPALASPAARPNTDAMTTITEAPIGMDEPDDDDFSDLEFSPRASLRRRKRIALGLVAGLAAVVAVLVVRPDGHAARSHTVIASALPNASAPTIASLTPPRAAATTPAPAVASSVPSIEKLGAPVVEKLAAPVAEKVAAPVAEKVAAPVVEKVAAPVVEKVAAPKHIAKLVAPKQTAVKASDETARPVVTHVAMASAPATAETTADVDAAPTPAVVTAAPAIAIDSVDAVVAKYQNVAKALRRQPDSPAMDDLWTRFRLIRINDAIASEQSRHQALALLTAIEKAIR